ncbi:MAG: hypothetical protein ACQETN_08275 [Bacillota bacterium]
MIKEKNLGLFSLLLFVVTMASLVVGRNGSLIAANLGVSTGAAAILAVLKKQGKAKAAAF